MQKATEPLPEPFQTLVRTIGANHPESGGENRKAVAELQARLALAQDRTASRLGFATWVLAVATIVLAAATIALIFVTATGG